MFPWKSARTYLLRTLPSDMKVALTVMASKKLQACAVFLGLVALTLLVGLLVMWIVTGNLPTVAVNTDYWGLAVQRLMAATAGALPATLLETIRVYLDYPAIWFTFERIGFQEQVRTLAMDTTTAFPVINVRYFLENAPIALLLALYLVLSRHQTKETRSAQLRGVSQVVSISIPGSSGAMASALAPMACCGGAAVQSAAYAVGFMATAPIVLLLSKLAAAGVGVLLVVGIAWTARKINASNTCVPP